MSRVPHRKRHTSRVSTFFSRTRFCWTSSRRTRRKYGAWEGRRIDTPTNPHPLKNTPLFFSQPGMDFYVVLTRPGYRVAKRRSRQARIGVQHRIGREDAIKWFQAKFDGVVLNKAS